MTNKGQIITIVLAVVTGLGTFLALTFPSILDLRDKFYKLERRQDRLEQGHIWLRCMVQHPERCDDIPLD